MDEQVQLRPILDRLAERPPLDLASSEGLEDELPQIAGGIAVALARIFTIVDPKVNPASEGWDRAVRIFRLLL
jgi:hypothetical protein